MKYTLLGVQFGMMSVLNEKLSVVLRYLLRYCTLIQYISGMVCFTKKLSYSSVHYFSFFTQGYTSNNWVSLSGIIRIANRFLIISGNLQVKK